MASGLEISEIASDEGIASAYPLMAILRPYLRREDFVEQVRAQQREGYRLIGGFEGGRWVALAGFRFARSLSRGPHLFVDDLVTAPAEQGKGHGRAMLRYLAGLAREAGVPRIHLDSRDTAKTFYERVGFKMTTSIPCGIDVEGIT
jgi:GNAT superfamily N-acetyltransferase